MKTKTNHGKGLFRRFSLGFMCVIAFLLIFLLMVFYSFLTYEDPDVSAHPYVFEVQKLEKNMDLQLKQNETYVYLIKSFGTIYNLTYITGDTPNSIGGEISADVCLPIYEVSQQETVQICVDNKGLYPPGIGSNISYGTAAYVLFKPWMLAVDENWEWNVTTLTKYEGVDWPDEYSYIIFKTVGEETVFGRNTYKIEVTIDDVPEYYWIDKEKRVLIKKEGFEKAYLINAPFTLELQQGG